MNSLVEEELPGIYQLRDRMMEMLSDDDLRYKLPGNNPTFGELCLEMGRTQQIYAESFKTLKMDWQLRGSVPESADTVDGLNAWFKTLDAELEAAVNVLSEEDLDSKHVDRGHGFTPSAMVQFKIYHEALLMFYAKASVYLKALEKDLSGQWHSWIG